MSRPGVRTSTPVRPRPHGAVRLDRRVARGARDRANWWQLGRFAVVGASGYVVNLTVFALALHLLGTDYRVAAVLAFAVAVVNNFWWNRHWTFGARGGHAGFQAARFFTISVTAFLVNLAVLQLLVTQTALPEIAAQAIAIVAATPLNFIGNKMWTFGRSVPRR